MAAKRQTRGFPQVATVALLGLVGGLGYVAWSMWGYSPDTSAIRAPIATAALPSAKVDDGASVLPAPRVIAEFRQTTQRPLFFSDRRPADRSPPKVAEVVVMAPPVPPSPLEQMQLLGISRGINGQPRALVRPSAEGQGVWITVGDIIRGWKVAEISEQNAVFLANGLRGELQLFAARAKVR